jgi:hypothetical protein
MWSPGAVLIIVDEVHLQLDRCSTNFDSCICSGALVFFIGNQMHTCCWPLQLSYIDHVLAYSQSSKHLLLTHHLLHWYIHFVDKETREHLLSLSLLFRYTYLVHSQLNHLLVTSNGSRTCYQPIFTLSIRNRTISGHVSGHPVEHYASACITLHHPTSKESNNSLDAIGYWLSPVRRGYLQTENIE